MGNKILEEINFKKLSLEDSKKYRFLRLESLQKYPNHFGSKYKEQKEKEKLAFEKFIEESNPECFVVGAFFTRKLIGICAFYKSSDDRYKHRGEIIQMYVQPQYQQHKIGFNLLKATINKAFEIEVLEQIELDVITTIKPANQIYEKVGFKEYSLLRKYIKNDETYYDKRSMILYRPNLSKKKCC